MTSVCCLFLTCYSSQVRHISITQPSGKENHLNSTTFAEIVSLTTDKLIELVLLEIIILGLKNSFSFWYYLSF